ncbi:MAG: DUF4129 domain-containing protein [Anaerolineae bacterium]|nr:DUF4129 domain-containing protein [Anaerolineae bacterium]
MTNAKKLLGLLLFSAALFALIFLSTGLPEVSASARRYAQPEELTESVLPPEENQASSDAGKIYGAAASILVLLLPVGLILVLISPEARKRFLQYILAIIPFGGTLILIIYMSQAFGFVEDMITDRGPTLPKVDFATGDSPEIIPNAPSEPPEWFAYTASFIVVAGVLAAGWYLYDRNFRQTPLEQIVVEMQEALDQIQAGADLNDTIMQCYYDMASALRKQRGIKRNQAMTPREFEASLAQAGMPRNHIHQLTQLFEGVRYGAKTATQQQEDLAIECLTAILQVTRTPA